MTETAMGGGAYNVSWLSHIPAQDRPNTVLVMYDNKLFIIDGRQGFVLTGSAPRHADERAMQALFDSIAGSLTFVRG